MRFSTQEDVNLPAEAAFAAVVDPDYLERQLLRRGIEVTRTDRLPDPGCGMSWTATVDWAGRARTVTGAIVAWERARRAVLDATAGGLTARLSVEFLPLSRKETRLRVALDLKADTFRDRMLLRSLRISKARLSAKFAALAGDTVRAAERRRA